jgi:hypothetical protein
VKLPLTGGAYQARSVIAAAQRCLNLYVEPLPEAQGEPSRAAHYPTPGLTLFGTIGTGPIRGLYRAADNETFCVSGTGFYRLNLVAGTGALIGAIDAATPAYKPVGMVDNGLEVVIVDGGPTGWSYNLSSTIFGPIADPNFQGSVRADYLDGYFLFSHPGSIISPPIFYSSDFLALTFDPLWIANKIGFSDLLRTVVVTRRTIWLIGDRTTEIWSNTGKPDFPFEAQPDVFIDHGIVAVYSVATFDNGVFWLTADRTGQGIVLQGAGYQTKRISTYAIEAEIAGYTEIKDAIGYCVQYLGHTMYVLTFPTADKTWVYDITTGHWHEWLWTDPATGLNHRHRSNCFCAIEGGTAGGMLLVGDWQNGNVYKLDQNAFTDNGAAIHRLRSFPHMLQDGRRVFYNEFLADMETGTATGDTSVSLRWSNDRGHTWGAPVAQSLNTSGTLTSLQWQRLGLARDRVWELSWTAGGMVALQGAWIDAVVGDAPTAAPAAADA